MFKTCNFNDLDASNPIKLHHLTNLKNRKLPLSHIICSLCSSLFYAGCSKVKNESRKPPSVPPASGTLMSDSVIWKVYRSATNGSISIPAFIWFYGISALTGSGCYRVL